MVKKSVIIAGGGTGGHIFPAIKIAEKFIDEGYHVIYIGNRNSLEEKISKEKKIDFRPILVYKLHRKICLQNLFFPIQLIRSILKSVFVIYKTKPVFFIGTGGYVSGPVAIASLLMNLPIYLHEQNSVPGLTNRFMQKYAKRLFVGMKLKQDFRKNNILLTGNPINYDLNMEKKIVKNHRKFFRLLFLGGSQGSVVINRLASSIMNEVNEIINNKFSLHEVEIFWQTGTCNVNEVLEGKKHRANVKIFGFISDISKVYCDTDLVVTRGGALVLSELESYQIPMVIIPLSSSSENHQFYNAREYEKRGSAIIVNEGKNIEEEFKDALIKMFQDYEKYKNSFKDSIHLKAVTNIYKSITNDFKNKD